MARLMLVTDYAGLNMVKVYAPGAGSVTGMKAGRVTIGDGDGDTTTRP